MFSFLWLTLSVFSVFLSSCLSVFLCFCLPVSLSSCVSVFLSSCLSVFLSICLSVFLSSCLSVFLSFCLFLLSRCRSVSSRSVFLSNFHSLSLCQTITFYYLVVTLCIMCTFSSARSSVWGEEPSGRFTERNSSSNKKWLSKCSREA